MTIKYGGMTIKMKKGPDNEFHWVGETDNRFHYYTNDKAFFRWSIKGYFKRVSRKEYEVSDE